MPYNVTVATGMARRMYVLRGGVLARDCIARTLRIDVPVTPNTVTSCSGKSLLWLGPEEWLLNVPEGEEDPLAGGYSPIECEETAVIVDVSDHYTVISIGGSESVDVLSQACGIDLAPESFSSGQCARCAFARTTGILRPLDDRGGYELIIESSYAKYAEQWLTRAIGKGPTVPA